MAARSSKRILLGALAGGLAWVVWSGLVNLVVLGGRYPIAQQRGTLLDVPRYPFFFPVYILLLFVVSYILAWLYAGLRATYGAGPRTALTLGLLVGFAIAFPGNFVMASWAPMARVFPFWWLLQMWLGAIIAAFLAGWLYREE